MAQLVVTILLFVLLFAPLNAGQRSRSINDLRKGKKRNRSLPKSLGDSSTGITNQNNGRAGLQAQLRWSQNEQYVLEIGIGDPAHNASLIVDTYDSFIWNDCLQSSGPNTVKPYYPDSSITYRTTPCNSQQWEDILKLNYCEKLKQCRYDCSWAKGLLANETFSFGGSTPLKLSFGCNDMKPFNYTDSTGYAGMGRGPLSLISQLSFSKFSYCFTDAYDDSISSYMFFGSFADLDDNVKDVNTTRLINDSNFYYYYLDLEGISVNSNRLAIPPETLKYVENYSGTIIYTTDPLTYLVAEAYTIVKDEVNSSIHLPPYNQSAIGDFNFDLCFNWTADLTFSIPNVTLTFHFAGANMTVPVENLFLGIDDGNGTTALCLMIVSIDGNYSYLGSFLQQNLQLIYDLNNGKLSFRSIKCDQLPAHKSVGIKFDLRGTTFWVVFFLYILLV